MTVIQSTTDALHAIRNEQAFDKVQPYTEVVAFCIRLKSFLFCKSSLLQPFLFLIQVSLYAFPRLFTVTSEHIRLFTFSVFTLFLVVGSVRQIKLTYVSFRAHVKIASRIVSYCMIYPSLTSRFHPLRTQSHARLECLFQNAPRGA